MKQIFPKFHINSLNALERSVLSNGVEVVSIENSRLLSCLTFGFKNSGLKFETKENFGFGSVLNEILFSTSSEDFSYSDFMCNKCLYEHFYSLDDLHHEVTFVRDDLKEIVPLFCSGTFRANITPEAIEKTSKYVEKIVNEALMNPNCVLSNPFDGVMFDKLREITFSSESGMGNPKYFFNENINEDSLNEYYKERFSVDNLIVAACGVNHEELVNLLEENLPKKPNKQAKKKKNITKTKMVRR